MGTEVFNSTASSTANEEHENTLRYCWKGTLEDWLNTNKNEFLKEMQTNYRKTLTAILHPRQKPPIDIWEEEYETIYDELETVNRILPGFSIIFEYTIPGTSNSRPDILLISKTKIIIIEYKNNRQYEEAEDVAVFQTGVYYRELANMHKLSFDCEFYSFVYFGQIAERVLDKKRGERKNFYFCGKNKLRTSILRLIPNGTEIQPCDVDTWINSPYEPRPDIQEAAQRIFKGENLRDIRVSKSTKIPTTLNELKKGVVDAQKNKKHYAVFVSGVPGAGKTYLGLQLVYDYINNAQYYSGNGPLVDVLQAKLRNSFAVKGVDNLVNDCLNNLRPHANILVFDEGQRAWDNTSRYNESEPEILLRSLEKLTEWCFFVILIGDGQAIYRSEPNDLSEWQKALNKRKDTWTIRCPEKYKSYFERPYDVVQDYLDLDTPIRTITAENKLLKFVKEVVGKFKKILYKDKNENKDINYSELLFREPINIIKLKEVIENLKETGYEIQLTRDFYDAKESVARKLSDFNEKTYGIIASREDFLIENQKIQHVVRQSRYSKNSDITYGQWYDAYNAHSCRKLEAYVDELGCQGLELDYTIVCWGSDLRWNKVFSRWDTFNKKRVSLRGTQEEFRRINSYRVLLTRARYGMTIYVPKETYLDDTYEFLQDLFVSV